MKKFIVEHWMNGDLKLDMIEAESVVEAVKIAQDKYKIIASIQEKKEQ